MHSNYATQGFTEFLTQKEVGGDVFQLEIIEVSYHPIMLHPVRTTSAEGSSSEGLRQDAQNTSQATTRE